MTYSRASCPECPGTYELVPPTDPEYEFPKEKPTSEDHIKRYYEWDQEKHRVTVYWKKKEYFVESSKPHNNVVREGNIRAPIPSGFAYY
jgi:hypothetical protein